MRSPALPAMPDIVLPAAEEMANVVCCLARFAENRIDLTGDGRKSLFHEIAGLIDRPALTKTGVLFMTLS
jgi:hypothetical protein